MEILEKFNAIHKAHKSEFKSSIFSLHNLLWQILINERFSNRMVAFTPVIREGETQIAIAEFNVSGYVPTAVAFENPDFDSANDICDQLNEEVFGLNEDTAVRITFSSMRQDKKRVQKAS